MPAAVKRSKVIFLLPVLVAALGSACNDAAVDNAPEAGATSEPVGGLTPDQAAKVVAKVGDRVITLGDFVSLYLALLNNIDPTPVDLIEKLKLELA